jgi:hypothetical protein
MTQIVQSLDIKALDNETTDEEVVEPQSILEE